MSSAFTCQKEEFMAPINRPGKIPVLGPNIARDFRAPDDDSCMPTVAGQVNGFRGIVSCRGKRRILFRSSAGNGSGTQYQQQKTVSCDSHRAPILIPRGSRTTDHEAARNCGHDRATTAGIEAATLPPAAVLRRCTAGADSGRRAVHFKLACFASASSNRPRYCA